MNPEQRLLFQNTHWQSGTFLPVNFHRDIFTEIWKDLDTKLISLLTGPRRTGKSTILKQCINKLIIEKGVNPRQILFFEFSPSDKLDIIWNILNQFKNEIANPREKVYVFFDEIQYLNGYEEIIKEIYDNSDNTKIFLTGSLSLSYKKRMNESLAGRFFEYKIFPLNFFEYIELFKPRDKEILSNAQKTTDKFQRMGYLSILNADFREFLSFGRFPELKSFDQNQSKMYLNGLLNQSLNQDVFAYFDIEKPQVINALFEYLSKNNGSEASINKISSLIGVSNQTATSYLNILEVMGLIYVTYNTSNPLLKVNASKKIYVNSSFGLLNSILDIKTSMGFAVESYILERLLEKGEKVSFWRKRNKEIDFLLPIKKIGYEIKYRDEVKKKNIKLKGFSIKIVSRNEDLPACLF